MFRRTIACLTALPFVAGGLAAGLPGSDGVNRFAADAYRQLARNQGNIVFSPLSISAALSMALAGAHGNTAQEITAVLHTPAGAALLDELERKGNTGGDQLMLAQALWVDRGMNLLPDFVRAMQEQFHAAPSTADFTANPESARSAINQWTARQTRDKIRELFAPG